MPNTNSTRAGKYEKQPDGFSAFIPTPLPPNPRIRFTNNLQQALLQAERALDRLNGSVQTLPKPERFEYMYIRHEAVMSSKIEGRQSTLLDLLASEAQISTSKYSNDLQEVLNYKNAMKYSLKQIKTVPSLTPISLEIHRRLLQNTKVASPSAGTFRTKQNWIGPSGCSVHNAVFVPPPPNLIEPQMRALDQFVDNGGGLPPLVKIGLVHAQFETIHPFLNDNGLVSRLLVTLLLHKNQIAEKPVLNLSWFFNRHRQEYYDKLQMVRNEGNWEDWLLFFLRAVREVSKYSAATVRRILEIHEENRQVINEQLGRLAANGHRVLDRLFEFPFVSVNEVRKLTGTTFAAANALVARMVDCGLLLDYTERYRNRRYLLYKYVDLFGVQ